MRNRTWRLLMFGLVAVVCSFTLTLLAVSEVGVFEFDGNAKLDGGQDWQNAITGVGTLRYTGAIVDMHLTPADPTAFGSNKTKDIVDLPDNWTGAATSVPDKDDINNAYAAAYVTKVDGVDHTIITFGADRYSAGNGTAYLGFWFFQDSTVAPPPAGTKGRWSGQHVEKDLLVLVNFEGGGDTPYIKIYQWKLGAPDNLEELYVGYSKCGTDSGNPACAVTNTVPVQLFWDSAYKGVGSIPAPGWVPELAFFEGGVDLTALFGDDMPCISRFLAETRSSSTLSADLKDYAYGFFDLCSVGISKACASGSADLNHLTFTNDITVTNTGVGTLYNLLITDTYQTGSSTTATHYFAGDCGSLSNCTTKSELVQLGAGASVTIPATFDTQLLTATNNASVAGAPTPAGTRTVSAGPASATCTVEVAADVEVVKNCYEGTPEAPEAPVTLVPDGGILKVQVKVWGTITSQADGTNIVITSIVDDHGGAVPLPAKTTLSPGDSVTFGPFPYFPSAVSIGACETGFTCFTDIVTVTWHAVLGDTADKTHTGTVSCPLCPPECLTGNSCQPSLSMIKR